MHVSRVTCNAVTPGMGPMSVQASGSRDRRPRSAQRAKSRSRLQSSRPCSMATAARCASDTRRTDGCDCRSASRTSRCRGPGSGIQALGRESHERTTEIAASTGKGRSHARGCPTTRMKPVMEAHGRPTRAVPVRRSCSHDRAASWPAAEVIVASTSRLTSTRITSAGAVPARDPRPRAGPSAPGGPRSAGGLGRTWAGRTQ